MQTIRFQAPIKDGVIHIPKEQKNIDFIVVPSNYKDADDWEYWSDKRC